MSELLFEKTRKKQEGGEGLFAKKEEEKGLFAKEKKEGELFKSEKVVREEGGLFRKEEKVRRLGEGKRRVGVLVLAGVGLVIVGLIGLVLLLRAGNRLVCSEPGDRQEKTYAFEFDGGEVVKLVESQILGTGEAAVEGFSSRVRSLREDMGYYGEIISENENEFVFRDSDGVLISHKLDRGRGEWREEREYDRGVMGERDFADYVEYGTREEILEAAKEEGVVCK